MPTTSGTTASMSGNEWRGRITIPGNTGTGDTIRNLCVSAGMPSNVPAFACFVLPELSDGTIRAAFVVAHGRLAVDGTRSAVVASDFTTHGEFVSSGRIFEPLSIDDINASVRSSDGSTVAAIVRVLF